MIKNPLASSVMVPASEAAPKTWMRKYDPARRPASDMNASQIPNDAPSAHLLARPRGNMPRPQATWKLSAPAITAKRSTVAICPILLDYEKIIFLINGSHFRRTASQFPDQCHGDRKSVV